MIRTIRLIENTQENVGTSLTVGHVSPQNGLGCVSSEEYLSEVETIFSIRRPDMLRYLVRMGVNILEAEDIVQDVFVHVVNDANKKRPGNLFWWLLTCAKNLAVNRYRKGKRETLVSAQLWKQWESCIADKAHGPDLLHEERESLKLFQQAILELNDIEQQCILMRGQGITFREMSNSLNLPMRNIIYLTEMAIRKIRQHLAKNSQSV